MGVLNVTPDSFSDGGLHYSTDRAVQHALAMLDEGADIVDVGGMSTRPGAPSVPEDDELARVTPVVEGIMRARPEALVSIDTTKPAVAAAALERGAAMVNDVRGLKNNPELAAIAARSDAAMVLMHSSGTSEVMQSRTSYERFPGDIVDSLADSIRVAREAGVGPDQIICDPGFGFGKTPEQNVSLLQDLHELEDLGAAILCGVSRKSFLGALTGHPIPGDRDVATHVAGSLAVLAGAHILRVHDLPGARDSLCVLEAVVYDRAPRRTGEATPQEAAA
jgi:dihydropteroate synthase